MKGVVLTGYGDIDRLELREVAEPTPGPNEIAVRVAAAGINPIDWKLRSGALRAFVPLAFPTILGRDVSGTVISVGPGVTGFAVGMRVLGLVQGGYAETVVAQVDAWAELPANADLIAAAALPLAALTGAQLVEEVLDVRAGEHVLVVGATGGVGRAAVFTALARGARVYAGVRGKQRDAAAKLGVERVVALDDDKESARLPALDAIADTVGGATIERLLSLVQKGGRIGSVVGEPVGAKESGLRARSMLTHLDPRRLAQLARAAADGKLVIPIARRVPLAHAAEAQRLAEQGGLGGKILLTP